MRLSVRALIVCSTFVIGMAAAPLNAEPIDVTIPITSGSVNFTSPGTGEGSLLQLYGPDGFSLIADPQGGTTGPGCCLPPGTTRTLHAAWSGNDLVGTATYNGETYPEVGPLSSSNHASVNFISSPFTLPNFDGTTLITITAPATFTGFLSGHPSGGVAPATLNPTLVGSGVGIVSFLWLPGINQWNSTFATFQLSSSSDAVPEPSSILLVCLSLFGVYAAARHRRPVVQSVTNTHSVHL